MVYKFVLPFKGKVKTQLKIVMSKKGHRTLAKPKEVVAFENQVRALLELMFPQEKRPIQGYIQFHLVHYTYYKRGEEGLLEPATPGDLDNILKLLADVFQPVYAVVPTEENGKIKNKKVEIAKGVITNDKYIHRALLEWVPIEPGEQERIEVFVSVLREEELFRPTPYHETVMDLSASLF